MFFGLFLIFLIWFTYERRKADRQSVYSDETFWEHEKRASHTPTANIENLDYITLDTSVIPAPREDDPTELTEALEGILSLKDCRMLDLSAYTNTDLKLKYGTFNFTVLAKADADFSALIEGCDKAGDILAELNRYDEAYRLVKYAADLSGINRLQSKADTLSNFMSK